MSFGLFLLFYFAINLILTGLLLEQINKENKTYNGLHVAIAVCFAIPIMIAALFDLIKELIFKEKEE